jgi:hypothetical protein
VRCVVIGFICAGTLISAACSDGQGIPTNPSASLAVAGPAATAADSASIGAAALSASSPRSGDVHVTKECSGFDGLPGSFCTITSSNIKAIEVDSRILYLQPDQLFSAAGSDVVLNPPGPGNNTAFGHCSLALGLCEFSGGTGKFTWFKATIDVSHNDDYSVWYWEGTYSFSPQD